jgi:hypothetical protein
MYSNACPILVLTALLLPASMPSAVWYGEAAADGSGDARVRRLNENRMKQKTNVAQFAKDYETCAQE